MHQRRPRAVVHDNGVNRGLSAGRGRKRVKSRQCPPTPLMSGCCRIQLVRERLLPQACAGARLQYARRSARTKPVDDPPRRSARCASSPTGNEWDTELEALVDGDWELSSSDGITARDLSRDRRASAPGRSRSVANERRRMDRRTVSEGMASIRCGVHSGLGRPTTRSRAVGVNSGSSAFKAATDCPTPLRASRRPKNTIRSTRLSSPWLAWIGSRPKRPAQSVRDHSGLFAAAAPDCPSTRACTCSA